MTALLLLLYVVAVVIAIIIFVVIILVVVVIVVTVVIVAVVVVVIIPVQPMLENLDALFLCINDSAAMFVKVEQELVDFDECSLCRYGQPRRISTFGPRRRTL